MPDICSRERQEALQPCSSLKWSKISSKHIPASEGPATQSDMRRMRRGKRNYTDGMDKLSPLSQKLYTRIKDDLKPWEEIGITQEMVEHTYCTVCCCG